MHIPTYIRTAPTPNPAKQLAIQPNLQRNKMKFQRRKTKSYTIHHFSTPPHLHSNIFNPSIPVSLPLKSQESYRVYAAWSHIGLQIPGRLIIMHIRTGAFI
ncbi:hypothetical protein OCU04_008704 [Sclerotinia nivalis]|uniref:Uncharacterized protein n=1 Tax=Sclerotinia nivalis TaxID=352851 RepID=A0A9X0AG06_9HELO|nr:hypothetical protein OCU04_008704 [Sclerotinia nivalis]